MNAKILLSAALVVAALAAEAVVVRKLPEMTVVENEAVSTDSLKATAVRSSNTSVFGAALRESGEAVVSGARLGEAILFYIDERGIFASRTVRIVPSYWDVLRGMFSEDPEITISIVGDKVVISGSTANVETLQRVESAKQFDNERIVTQVTYSTAQIAELVRDFLMRSNITNIGVNVVGREVCLSGRMYDTQSIEQLSKRVEGFVKDFPGITVNSDELRIYKQKILINIEFVAYNDTLSRNLGFEGPDSITATANWNFDYDFTKTTGGTYSRDKGRNDTYNNHTKFGKESGDAVDDSTRETTLESSYNGTSSRNNNWQHNWKGAAGAKVEGVQATINLLKKNGAAKTLYSTTLSTQSGIEAEFQSGGTFNRMTTPGMGSNGDLVQIEYGYIIKATPLIIDESSVNLDFNLDNKQPVDSTGDHIERYLTRSKYLVRPGEAIMLSGYKYNSESETKKGTPWLSKIPLIGPWLFGNTQNDTKMNEVLLVVTVNWAIENDGDQVAARLKEMKDRKVEVDMP